MLTAEEWRLVAEAFDARVAACAELPFQSLPAGRIEAVDPASGRRVLVNPARAGRPRTRSAGNAYREGRTPPTLSFVAVDGSCVPQVETETESAATVRELLEAASSSSGRHEDAGEGVPSPWEVAEALGRRSRTRADGTRVPVVFPRVPWRARTFFNLAPIVADRVSGANGFVVAVAPEYEAGDLGRLIDLLPPRGAGRPGAPASTAGAPGTAGAPASPATVGTPLLPGPVFDAVVYSWALLEQWTEMRGLVPVPFINGGKGAMSGQSLDCFHAQFYAVPTQPPPPFHEALRAADERGECPLCRLTSTRELEVRRVGSVGVWAHPAPETEATLVVAAADHTATLVSLPDVGDFARGIEWAVRGFERLLGGVPPYNIAVRCGRYAGHLHAEVIPRAGVAVAAGFEKSTGFLVSTRPPAAVAAELRARAVIRT